MPSEQVKDKLSVIPYSLTGKTSSGLAAFSGSSPFAEALTTEPSVSYFSDIFLVFLSPYSAARNLSFLCYSSYDATWMTLVLCAM